MDNGQPTSDQLVEAARRMKDQYQSAARSGEMGKRTIFGLPVVEVPDLFPEGASITVGRYSTRVGLEITEVERNGDQITIHARAKDRIAAAGFIVGETETT